MSSVEIKTAFVYRLFHPKITSFYIGSTNNIEKRLKRHISNAKNKAYSNQRLYKVMKANNPDEWKIETICGVVSSDRNILKEFEFACIADQIEKYGRNEILNTCVNRIYLNENQRESKQKQKIKIPCKVCAKEISKNNMAAHLRTAYCLSKMVALI